MAFVDIFAFMIGLERWSLTISLILVLSISPPLGLNLELKAWNFFINIKGVNLDALEHVGDTAWPYSTMDLDFARFRLSVDLVVDKAV